MSNGTDFGNYTARLPDSVWNTDSVRYADSYRNASTLLIPENTVWLPYVGIVMTVLCWLGYDFYRFHKKNQLKYERVEEHRTILRACPIKQRISMVSGIGLRFKKGKPVLGDVWNTSPSSSDVSSCCSPVRHGRAYSREMTPSSDGGLYSEGETYSMRNTSSYVTITDDPDLAPEHKGWEIGGEYVGGMQTNKQANSNSEDTSSTDMKHSQDTNHNNTANRLNVTSPGSGSSSLTLTPGTTPTVESKTTDRLRRMMGAGGGVDDGGGGESGKSESSGSQDAVTQTDFDEAFFNMTTGERINYPYEKAHNPASYNTYPPPVHPMSWTPTVSSRHREGMDWGAKPYSPYHRASVSQDLCDPPVIIDFSMPHLLREERTVDSLGNPTAKHLVRAEKRLPSLRLDLLAAPCSPTTELVAKEHGFALEGVEVPHYAGGGSRSLPSSGSEIFKPKEPSRKSSQASVKPLTPSPAILSRINVPHTAPPRYSGSHHHHHHFHHRHRRPESLDIVFGMPSGAKTSFTRKPVNAGKPAASAPQPQRPPRATSSSPRARREHDKQGPLSSLKIPFDAKAPKTAPIPSHLYHQDEEGFFSSSHSSSYNPSRVYPPEVDTSKKGILFFSRLAGAGRANSSTGGFGDQSTGSASSTVYGTGVYGKQGSYKSGGFES